MSASDARSPTVADILSALRRRQRLLNAARWGAVGLLAGAAAGSIAGAADWLAGAAPLARPLAIAGVGLAALGAAGAAIGLLLPVSELRLARALDRAAASEDRFASAVQLESDGRRARVGLVVADALARVSATPARAALPMRLPRAARWVPVPLLALGATVLLFPQARLEASAPVAPAISAEEWAGLHEEFARELARLPEPVTPEEEELMRDFRALAELLRTAPDKKDALTEIARLSERLEKQREAAGAKESVAQSAAKAVSESASLKEFGSALKQGAYAQAAGELRRLAERLKDGSLSPDAAEFEAMSADMQRLSKELASRDDLRQACESCANAAGKMNSQSLSDAMRRLAERMQKDAESLRACDNLGKRANMLDALKRRMNQCTQCSGCKQGCSACEGGSAGSKPGGRKAGWGSAAKWVGGSMAPNDEKRSAEVADVREGAGASATLSTVSPDERAQTSLRHKELYAEFVQKAEADLDLESVPLAHRDFLRRYFNAIRPVETAPAGEGAP